MAEQLIKENELPPNLRGLHDKAVNALKMNNPGYAVQLEAAVVKEEPRFLDGRKLLRRAQGLAAGPSKKSLLDTSSMTVNNLKKKHGADPMQLLSELEDQVLAKDPFNKSANYAIFEIAANAGMLETAAFALETVVQGDQKDTKTLHKLAEFHMAHEDPERAVKIYQAILKINPTDGDARKGETNSNAKASLKKTNFGDESGDWRKLIKNSGATADIEAASRVGATREQMEEQVAILAPQYEANPNDLNVVKKIADLYERMEEWESALGYYSWAFQLSAGDTSLEAKMHKAQDKVDEGAIKSIEAYLEASPDAPDAGTYREQLAGLIAARAEKNVAIAKEAVDRNPTDPALRFTLGQYLFDSGHATEAIPELQRAKSNPAIRHRAMVLLARCYDAKKMADIAAKQLEECVKEMQVMDGHKKDALYLLGTIYENAGRKPEAMECFKQIYEVDYHYKDVAHRVESSYGG